MKKYILTVMSVLILILLIAGLSGCGTSKEAEPVSAGENTIIIQDYKFQPAEITIKSGETVTWINKDSVKHTATGDNFDTGLLGKEESFQITFDKAGTYDYRCTPHPYMKAKVIVE